MVDEISRAIAADGFRRWYERQLVRCHLQLLLLVLCLLALLGALEAFGQARQEGRPWWLMALCFAAAGVLGAVALRRYLFLLMRAEHIANQACCPACKAYGRWRVEPEPAAPPAPDGALRLRACCKACQARWHIHC